MDPNNLQQPQPTPIIISPDPLDTPAPIIPSVVPAETTVSVPESPKKGSPLVIIAIVLAVVAILAVVAYVFAAKFLTPQQSVPVLTPIPTPVVNLFPTTASDPTASWRSYMNTKYGYQFKYPSNYAVDQNGMTSKTPEIVEAIAAFDKTANDSTRVPRFAVTVTQLGQGSLQKQASDHYTKLSKFLFGDVAKTSSDLGYTVENNQPLVTLTKTTFQNLDAYTYTIKGSSVDDGGGAYITSMLVHKYIWVQTSNNIFLITLDDVNLTNQILSTFKFTEVTPAASPIANPTTSPSSTPVATS